MTVPGIAGACASAFCGSCHHSISDQDGYSGTVAALWLKVNWQQVNYLICTIYRPAVTMVNGFASGNFEDVQISLSD